MRGTIDWSYRLLDDDEQRLFQWLAVFSNGFELDAARYVGGTLGLDERSTTEFIGSLVHKSMISADHCGEVVRYRMLETMRAFALEQLDDQGERLTATTAQAEWVTCLTDSPVGSPCSAAVEFNTIRLEREADNWRDAVLLATRISSGRLAGRLCGPPTAYFLLGRHDLTDLVSPLLDLADNPSDRRSVLVALLVSGAGAVSAERLRVWADEVFAIEATDLTGVGTLMQWLTLGWRGDFETSVKLCHEASLDDRLDLTTRDMCLGIATLDRFSLTDAFGDPDSLIVRALEVADRSEVAMHRVICVLGAAWGVSTTQPDRALELVRRALAEIADIPALTRLTLPGTASRLLARLDPRVAAAGLLELLDSTPVRRSFVDLIPTFYATALLHRVKHPSASTALATLTVTPAAPYLSMMDFIDLARQAAATTSLVSLSELESMVRSALCEIIHEAA